MAISPLNTANSFFNINAASSKRESATPEAEASNVNSSQKARLYNPQTGKTMTPDESEQLFHQVTSQPYWNRHDVNFYGGLPVAMKLPEKLSPAAGDLNPPETAPAGAVVNNEAEIEAPSAMTAAEPYNPKTSEAMSVQQAEELFQQVTSQPYWNRHDLNFYAGPPVAIVAADKQSPASGEAETLVAQIAASEDNSRPVESSQSVTALAVTAPVEKPQIGYASQAQSRLSETGEYEKDGNSQEAVNSLWNNRNYDYYQFWLDTLAGNYLYDDEQAWDDFLTSPGRRFWDVKV